MEVWEKKKSFNFFGGILRGHLFPRDLFPQTQSHRTHRTLQLSGHSHHPSQGGELGTTVHVCSSGMEDSGEKEVLTACIRFLESTWFYTSCCRIRFSTGSSWVGRMWSYQYQFEMETTILEKQKQRVFTAYSCRLRSSWLKRQDTGTGAER